MKSSLLLLVAACALAGLAITILARRACSSLPFLRAWLLYFGLVGFLVAVTLLVALS